MSMRTLPLWLAAVWAISLTTLGFFVVPMLFVHLPTPAMAGAMAAKLFTAQTWISVASGMLLLAIFRSNRPLAPVDIAQAATLFVVTGVLLALLVEFAVAPHIVARDNLALWHRVGSAMYFAQWVCALVVFGKLAAARSSAAE
jgi:Domain of unknown function (DUF4149)